MARGASLAYHLIYLFVGFLYPAYASLIAIETPDKKDDSIWLMYWIVFAVFSLLEFGTDFAFSWLPFYSSLKVLFLLWCCLPLPHNGAIYLFKIFIQPFFQYYGKQVGPVLTDFIDKTSNAIPPYPSEL